MAGHKIYLENLTYMLTVAKDKLSTTGISKRIFRSDATFKSKHLDSVYTVHKYLCIYNPGYQCRYHDENNFHLIIKHNQEYYSK